MELIEYCRERFKELKEKYVKVEIKNATADNGKWVKKGVAVFIKIENGKEFSRFLENKRDAFAYFKEIKEKINKYELSDFMLVERMLDKLFLKSDYLAVNRGIRFDLRLGFKDELITEFIRANFPYCIEIVKDEYGVERTILLNRDYKPLGVFGYSDFVGYLPYAKNRGILGKYLIEFYEKFKDENDKRMKKYYFYDDGMAPYYGKNDLLRYLFFLKLYLVSVRVRQGFIMVDDIVKELHFDFYKLFYAFGKINDFYNYYDDLIEKFLRRFDANTSRS